MTETIQVDEDLAAKRSALEDKISALRLAPEASELIRQASDAVAKQKAETAALENEIAEIDAISGVLERNKREAEYRQWLEDVKAAIAQARHGMASKLDAWSRFGEASAALAAAINDIRGSRRVIAEALNKLPSDGPAVHCLGNADIENRMGMWFSGGIAKQLNAPPKNRIGSVELPGSPMDPSKQEIRDVEGKRLAPIAEILNQLEKENF